MPVSITHHYETTRELCNTCGSPSALVGVITVEGEQCRFAPRCTHCITNRVSQGVIQAPPKQVKPPDRRKRRLSRKQEQQIMADIGGRTQSASGARNGYKGDGRLYDRIRMEAKYTFSKRFALDKQILSKIRSECAGKETPALVIDFKDKSTGLTKDRWVVVPYEVWVENVNASSDNK